MDHVVLTASLSQAATPFLHFLSHILPMTTNEEIVALNLTCLLVFSLIDVKFANQPQD